MINLGDNPYRLPSEAAEAEAELRIAGVEPIRDVQGGKVMVTGQLCGFTFRRAWYYWMVSGKMPAHLARRLNADPGNRQTIRVAGQAGGDEVDPWIEWFTPAGDALVPADEEAIFDRLRLNKAGLVFFPDPAHYPGAIGHITSYHVDTQEALCILADAIKGVMI